MIDLSFLRGKTIAVLGLGKSGVSAVQALQAGGAVVWAWDDEEHKRQEAGFPLTDLNAADFSAISLLVISPGIPHTFPQPHPVALRAKEARVPLICDVDLLLRAERDVDVIAITGTNGKSTTTALIGHILKNFRPTEVGGNIGLPALTLNPLGSAGTYVLELSSYQLELTPTLKAKGAILLNLSPDHIERHGDMAGYIAAKENLFNRPGDVAVIGIDTEPASLLADRLDVKKTWKVVPVSTRQSLAHGVYVEAGKLYDNGEMIADLMALPNLKGVHNHENAACAYAVIKYVYGYASQDIISYMMTFPGLPHRQYPVRQMGHVSYINDSKATNADAAARALSSFNDIYWIIGGLSKEGGLSGLELYKDRIRQSFLIGKASDEFALWLERENMPYTRCETLERAVMEAHVQAQKAGKGTVLLSPACASWDQFRSFEHRGDVFTNLVNALPEAIAA